MQTVLRLGLWISILSHFGLAPLFAQTAVVKVTQEESGVPVPGALLTFLGADGTLIRNALTDSGGRFLFRSDVPLEFTVRAEMIGREAVEQPGLVLEAGSTLTVHLPLPINAIPLEGIEVRGEERCRLRPDEASGISVVWEEARKALRAQAWTEKTELYRYQIVQFDRILEPDSHQMVSENRSVRASVMQVPFQSLPAEQLFADGFVQSEGDGSHVYYGPDASVLLSDQFLDTHCLHLQAKPEEPGSIGLGFEPVHRTDFPDISGTFWLDRETARLQFLEFRYTWSPVREARGVAGGRVEFQAMPNGAWIVRRWWIRMPQMRRTSVTSTPDGSGVRLANLKETGSEITSVSLADQSRASERETGAVQGVVWDSVRASPLAGAQVYISGTQYSSESDASGYFFLDGLPEGLFTVAFTHPRLDSLGVRDRGVEVEVSGGDLTETHLSVPSWPTVLALICDGEVDSRTFVAKGQVRDIATGQPIPDAEVRVAWKGSRSQTGSLFRERDSWFETRTNEVGQFMACGIPLHQDLEVRASYGGHESRNVLSRVAAMDVFPVNLGIEFPSTDSIEVGVGTPLLIPPMQVLDRVPGSMGVVGEVVDAGSGTPISGSTILLKDSLAQVLSSASSNETGHFQVVPPRAGLFQIQISNLGYSTVRALASVRKDSVLTIRVALPVEPVELGGIDVRVQPTAKYAGMTIAGFRARQASGIGEFFGEQEIVDRRPSRITDLIIRAPGLRVLTSGGRPVDVRTSRSMGGIGARQGKPCLPDIWLDGTKVREGGYRSANPRSTLFLNDIISPEQIGGIEVYAGISQIPAQFRGSTSMCGTVVIWSRRAPELRCHPRSFPGPQ